MLKATASSLIPSQAQKVVGINLGGGFIGGAITMVILSTYK